ncbi:MAG TPA: hypothetical protein O0X01_06940 [Methanocorpusculum sp.]|nr:hypothetical protein [Methanocorpusculum sp.]
MRYQKKSPKKIKLIMVIFLIVIVMLIIGASLFGLLLGATYIFDQSLSDPDVLLNPVISGNDIIVTIYEGKRVDEMVKISVQIEGYSPVVRDVRKGETEVEFRGIAQYITGTKSVGVRGIFSDGSVALLKVSSLKFT